MLSKKLLSALPFLAAHATAFALETSESKKTDQLAAIFDVLKVFYPNCEALKDDLSDKYSGRGVTCAEYM